MTTTADLRQCAAAMESGIFEAEYCAIKDAPDLLRWAADELDKREWQPIETAPKNALVLLGGAGRVESGFAAHGWERYGVSTMSYCAWATHWMPLPAPPRDE